MDKTLFCIAVSLLLSPLLVSSFAAPAFSACPEGTTDANCSNITWYFSGQKWADTSMPVEYYINKDGAANCTGDEFAAVRRGMKAWERIHQAYFAACYMDTTSARAMAYADTLLKDGKNVISWENLGGGTPTTLGEAHWLYKSNLIYEADIELNDNAAVKWSALSTDSCVSGRYDLQSVAAHEFGHWMSLGHSSDKLATMYCWTDTNTARGRTLNDCDGDAMRYSTAYPHTYGQPKPMPGCWPYYHADGAIYSPAIGDINRDGVDDVVFQTGDGVIHAISGSPARLYMWPDSSAVGFGFSGSAALGDVNGDGWLEVVFGDQNSRLHVLDHNSITLWAFPKALTGVPGTPAIGDIDKDGTMEIIVAASDSLVYAFNSDGTSVPGWPYKAGSYFTNATVGLADLDGDDSLEVVVAARDNKVCAIKPHGTDLSGWPTSVASDVFGPVAIGDIDGDNKYEVLALAWTDSLFAWNDNGSLCSGWPVHVRNGNALGCCTAPSIGNLDADAALEVIVGSRGDSVFAFNGNGSRVSGWPVYVDGYSQGSPLVLNIDSDAAMEVIAVTGNGKLYAFNNTGSKLTGYPVDSNSGYYASAAAGDINDDQEVELVHGSGAYYAGQHVGVVEGSGTYQWSMLGHDNHRTCTYGYVPPEVEPIVFSDLIADIGKWDLLHGGAGFAGLSTVFHSPSYSLGIQSSGAPGDFASGYSERIVLDFARPYEASFYFTYDAFREAKWFVFGHARLFFLAPDAPLMYDPTGDWSALVPIGPPVNSYLFGGSWETIEIRVEPAYMTYEIRIGGSTLGVAAYTPSLVPSDQIWFTDEPYENSELSAYYDDFEVRGYLPVVGTPEESPSVALENVLYQSFPNPMNPVATIRYSVKETGRVTLRVFDVAGRLVRTLVDDDRTASPSPYTVTWNGRDEGGRSVSSGVYFCQMEARSFRSAKKL
ncbi:MAG: FG-GAP-like repeat-containing protein, partial [Candidatus Eisenbacteria bacterium]